MIESTILEIYDDVERAIDLAFDGHFVLKFYDYLKIRKTPKKEIQEFINSKTAKNITQIVIDLEEYLKGGDDYEHKQLREGYGYLSKPQARKVKNYLYAIVEDAQKYNYEKRPGRRKKETK